MPRQRQRHRSRRPRPRDLQVQAAPQHQPDESPAEALEAVASPAALFQRAQSADPQTLQPQAILALQRTLGNQAVQRLLMKAPAAAHQIQRKSIKDRLNEALDGWSADVSQVRVIIAQASPAEKQEILNDSALLTRLSDKLSSGQMLEILKSLNAPLKMRLNAAMNGWGADKQAILDLTASASEPEKVEVMKDAALVARLKSELGREDMLQVLKNLNAPVKMRLNVAMDGWGADRQTILDLTAGASDTEKMEILKDAALVARFKSELSREDVLQVLKNIKAPVIDRLNAAMDGWGTDEAAIKEILKSAPADEQAAALADPALVARLKSELSIADASDIFKGAGVPFKRIIELLLDPWKAKLADLSGLIGAATLDEKKSVWSDAALMTKAEGILGRDAYLTFLTQLGMFHSGTTAEDSRTHTSAQDADAQIRAQLATYVGDAVKAGRKIEGQVAVVDDPDWDRAGEASYGKDTWHTGPPPKRTAINGFVDDSGRVWIHRNRGNAGTMIHEAIHKYSADSIRGDLSWDLNEGITEYFTRKVCAGMSPPITGRGNYAAQVAVANQLVALVGEATVAACFFNGDNEGLKKAFIAATSKEAWENFLKQMKAGNFAGATTTATPAPAPTPAPTGP